MRLISLHFLLFRRAKASALALVALAALAGQGSEGRAAEAIAEPPEVAAGVSPYAEPFFQQAVMPVLARRCLGCHGPDRQAGELRLDVLALGGTEGDELAERFSEQGEANELLRRIRSTDPEVRMPQDGSTLDETERAVLEHWAEIGAPVARWWSLVEPMKFAPPAPVEFADRPPVADPIDAFVGARLQAESLIPSPPATRERWLRRMSLDVVGLPPTPDEIDRFLADEGSDAAERAVDRSLASPAFGERWATWWLDLARYADTHGYESDEPRTVWPYRDRVVDSFNENLPFDRFTLEQLAGDLLPNAGVPQLLATGFHRNTLVNLEGGAKEDEFKDAAIKDRVDTTATVWLASTIQCAQCHDHKYDPVAQAEYYQLYAYFQPTTDKATAERSDEYPYFFGDVARRQALDEDVARRQELLTSRSPDFARRFDVWIETLRAMPEADRIATVGDALAGSMARQPDGSLDLSLRVRLERKFVEVDPENVRLNASVDEARKAADAYRAETTANPFILKEGPPALTQVHRRGNFLDLGDYVAPGVPASFGLTIDESLEPNRRQLAAWLADGRNPRTSRVVVNRVWQRLLGRGIVATAEDFGFQGSYPSHPELLDRLAVDFVESGWDFKALVRRIVLSRTYAQESSRVGVDERAERFFAVGPRYRLDAERIRDSLLSASGLLTARVGGPPVYPPQPASLFEGFFFEGGFTTWPESAGESRYRRGLYTFVKRTRLHPQLQTFDAPDRRLCTVTRKSTESPAAALYLLNSQEALEYAYGLAARTLNEMPRDFESDRIVYAYRLCTGENPSPESLAKLSETLEGLQADYRADRKATEALLAAAAPAAEAIRKPTNFSDAELAAWVLLARVLLNLDATITQR